MTRPNWQDAAVLALVVGAVYANSMSGSFHYDDFHSLVLNPHIRLLENMPTFFVDPSMFSVDAEKAMYRPLLLVSYALNYAWGGYEVASYHVFNIVVHMLCVFFIWRLAAEWSRGAALCAGLVFALHPVATEPVNYISSRSESMAVAFMLAALVLDRRCDLVGRLGGPLCFAAALLVKSMAVVLPGLLVLRVWWLDRERLDLRHLLPYLGVASVYMMVIVTNRFLGDSLAKAPRGLFSQLLTQCKGLIYYVKTLVVPVGLSVEPQFAVASSLWSGPVVASAAFVSSGVYCAVRAGRGRFYLGWALMALAPTLIIPLNVLVNEHRLYLPLAGLALGVGAWWGIRGHARLLWPGVACLVLWAGLAFQRNGQWRDESSLWQAAAATSPQMPRVHVHLGNAQRDKGRSAEARQAYARALELDAANRSARTNLANLYFESAATDSARRTEYLSFAARQYEEVLAHDPDYREALNNLGSARMALGDYTGAQRVWQRATSLHPNHAEAHFNMGLLQMRRGRPEVAISHFDHALGLGEDAEIHRERGHALVGLQRLPEAVRSYRNAARLAPGDISSRYNMAEVLLVLGESDLAQSRNQEGLARWREAERALREVLSLSPGHARARNRLERLRERLP